MSSESEEIQLIKQRKMAEMVKNMNKANSNDDAWPGEPVAVTDNDFEDFVGKHPKVVVDCWAPWCGPCRMLSPTIDALAKDMKGKIAFGKLNTDDNFQTSEKHRISSIPTLLFFKDGKLVDTMIGAAPRAMVENRIRKALG
jgi:thioredoxin 1